MKGLFLKEYYNMKGVLKVYLIFPFLIAFICYMNHSMDMLIFLSAFFGFLVVISSYAYDELCDFEKLALTLPLSRSDIVKSKFLFMFCSIAFGILISNAFANAMFLIFQESVFPDYNAMTFLYETLGCAIAIMFLNSIMLPFIIRFGTEKARIFILIVFISVGIVGFLFANVFGDSLLSSFQNISVDLAWLQNVIPYLVVVIAFVCVWISAKVSIHLMKLKEY